ncbi:glycosyltransferase family 39 protein [Patescibacteria group bacterium]|nr:glycosyltransferase family 39 protein [Patescibacteria group bacterium]
MTKASKLLPTIAAGLSFLSLILAKLDVSFKIQWTILAIFLTAIGAVVFLAYFHNSELLKKTFSSFSRPQLIILTFLVILTIVTRFILLKEYPFVAVGDEVRDGGLDAVRIHQQLVNLFSYGRYESHGLIIATFDSLFYPLFHNSVYLYRIPAAIIGSLDILFIFLITRLITNFRTAIFAALCLIALPVHLFYSRTEIVVIFSSFLSTIGLLCFFLWYRRPDLINLIVLSTFIGFSFNFHASIKAYSFVILGLLLAFLVWKTFRHKLSLQKSLTSILVVFGFVIVGFGPRLLYTDWSTFTHSRTITHDTHVFTLKSLQDIETNYLKSILVIFYEPTNSHFPDHRPLLDPTLALFFFIGLGAIFLVNRQAVPRFAALLLFLGFFTNSALTDWIGADHRIMPLIPPLIFIVAFGLEFVFSRWHSSFFRLTFLVTTLFLILGRGLLFFTEERANLIAMPDVKQATDYLMMHLLYDLPQITSSHQLCLVSSPYNIQNYNYLHYQEQRQFFYPQTNFSLTASELLPNSELWVFTGDCPSSGLIKPNHLLSVNCAAQSHFFCPLNFNRSLNIYY